jgi:hypothetical protein
MGDIPMGDYDIRWDDPPPDHGPPVVHHHDLIWKAVDDFFDYKNKCWKCSVEEVMEQVAPRLPMCEFIVITHDHAELLRPKVNIAWEDKIKKPKPVKSDDMTNVVRFNNKVRVKA